MEGSGCGIIWNSVSVYPGETEENLSQISTRDFLNKQQCFCSHDRDDWQNGEQNWNDYRKFNLFWNLLGSNKHNSNNQNRWKTGSIARCESVAAVVLKFRSSGMWHCVFGCAVPDVLKDQWRWMNYSPSKHKELHTQQYSLHPKAWRGLTPSLLTNMNCSKSWPCGDPATKTANCMQEKF